ncbi:unnamed protein product, partial [Meganyctiphanes norvegica]
LVTLVALIYFLPSLIFLMYYKMIIPRGSLVTLAALIKFSHNVCPLIDLQKYYSVKMHCYIGRIDMVVGGMLEWKCHQTSITPIYKVGSTITDYKKLVFIW